MAAFIIFASVLAIIAIPASLYCRKKEQSCRWMYSKRAKILVLILIIVLFAVFYYFSHEFLAIDTCLDRGGSWDETLKICRFQ